MYIAAALLLFLSAAAACIVSASPFSGDDELQPFLTDAQDGILTLHLGIHNRFFLDLSDWAAELHPVTLQQVNTDTRKKTLLQLGRDLCVVEIDTVSQVMVASFAESGVKYTCQRPAFLSITPFRSKFMVLETRNCDLEMMSQAEAEDIRFVQEMSTLSIHVIQRAVSTTA